MEVEKLSHGRLAPAPRQRAEEYPTPTGTYISRSLSVHSSFPSYLLLSPPSSLRDRVAIDPGGMEWWQKSAAVPVKPAWIAVTARLRRKKDGKVDQLAFTRSLLIVPSSYRRLVLTRSVSV
jgi:hypothetical protein